MKLGVFDSGLGGLLIARAIREHMPEIDMLYMGDTLHLPYGNRSDKAIYTYTRACMDFMFGQGCQLIVVACNTASAAALRRLQQEYLPGGDWPGRNIIGVVVPTLETAIERGFKNLGLIGTNYILQSDIYHEELTKISPDIALAQKATPLLVPLIEHDGEQWTQDVLAHYLKELTAQDIECLILGCTHYPALKAQIRAVLGEDFPIISQDEIIPQKLEAYLKAHPEYSDPIGRNGRSEFYVSDLTDNYKRAAYKIYGSNIDINQTDFHG